MKVTTGMKVKSLMANPFSFVYSLAVPQGKGCALSLKKQPNQFYSPMILISTRFRLRPSNSP